MYSRYTSGSERVAAGVEWKIKHLDAHDYFFNYAENLGAADCPIPVRRYRWHTTRPPACLDWWTTGRSPRACLTTVANWSQHSKKNVVWPNETYFWQKHREFRRFQGLPHRCAV